MARMMDDIQAMLRGESPPAPVSQLIGFTMVRVEEGLAVVTLEVQRRHANPMGTLHGGILCDIADAAMGIAYASTLAEGESFTTLDLQIRYLRPFWEGKLVATGKASHRGKTVGMLECDVVDDRGRVIAKSTSTCLTLRGDQARGR